MHGHNASTNFATRNAAALEPFTAGTDPSLTALDPILGGQFTQGTQPLQGFLQGDLGSSPAVKSVISAFNQNTLPVIQNQLALQGLGSSPIVADLAGKSLATALPQVLQNEQANRLQAFGLEGQALGQGAQNILGASGQRGQLIGGAVQAGQGEDQVTIQAQGQAGQQAFNAGQLQQSQLSSALGGFQGAGQLQRGIASEGSDANQLDFLRRQNLAEQSTTGLFGGSVLGSLANQTTETSGGGK